mmetsp:Transcript_8563/g.17781  ORF Transcript_8563/g.17781 Transcript_8563/m.17781 type:complete len:114 (+) Transcript_8563:370-711(+)
MILQVIRMPECVLTSCRMRLLFVLLSEDKYSFGQEVKQERGQERQSGMANELHGGVLLNQIDGDSMKRTDDKKERDEIYDYERRDEVTKCDNRAHKVMLDRSEGCAWNGKYAW